MTLRRDALRWSIGCFFITGVIAAYWLAWFLHRSLVASDTSAVYLAFERTFPAPDTWLALCMVLGGVALRRRSASAVLWLLMAAGAGGYLFSIDVAYDLQHGIWAKGGNGLVELSINVLTLVLSVAIARWTWVHRTELLNGQQENA